MTDKIATNYRKKSVLEILIPNFLNRSARQTFTATMRIVLNVLWVGVSGATNTHPQRYVHLNYIDNHYLVFLKDISQ